MTWYGMTLHIVQEISTVPSIDLCTALFSGDLNSAQYRSVHGSVFWQDDA